MDTDELIEDIGTDGDLDESEYRYEISVLEGGTQRGRTLKTLLKYRSKESPDVAEVYSPPRILPEEKSPD